MGRSTASPRIVLVSFGSPLDLSTWSGTTYHILAELRRRFDDVHVIDTPRLDVWLMRASRVLEPLGVMTTREPIVCAWYASMLRRRLKALAPDVVVAVAAEPKVAALAGAWPLVVISDSFFGNIVRYYERYGHLRRRSRANGDRQQRQLLDGGAVVLLSSEWAARTAAEDYGQPRARFRVAPFGANLDRDPALPAPHATGGCLKLLFVGYDWRRKGGPLVLRTFQILRERLGNVELHIVGCRPARAAGMAGVVGHGVLRKSRPTEAERLEALFRESSLFFMPSRREAYGLVYAEACAFGLPPVAADTGGVGTIIEHGVNGLFLPLEASAEDYADAIQALWVDKVAYGAMRLAARRAYETRLNWRAWGDAAEAAVIEAMATRRAPS